MFPQRSVLSIPGLISGFPLDNQVGRDACVGFHRSVEDSQVT